MRFMEIANPEDQLALWRLISDNVWTAVMAQAKQAAALKAQAAATPKPKKFKPKKPIPKAPQAPKPKPPTPCTLILPLNAMQISLAKTT